MRTALDWASRGGRPIGTSEAALFAPIDAQEVWGAGVTYERSKVARQEESESGGSFYDLVYTADRPELFFKATPSRVVGPGAAIRVRRDTKWCVPEPELALVISPGLELVGFTVGNDVSASDIEGENPLYLPQAKVYDACCALGPVVTLAVDMPPIRE
ncbi:MAG TPA: fumarylacetoacetate hydrolase family protein, partial [Isosphaeraceae bacterium]